MKTLITGLLLVGLTSLGFSQNGIEEVELSEVNVTPLNAEYLDTVQDDKTPIRAKRIEKIASRFDITETKAYDGKDQPYTVVFKETDGHITATYDKKGKIISSYERFNNVLLPYTVRRSVFKQYPDWTLHKDTYLVSYYHLNKDAERVFKVQLRKDGKRKNLKVDIYGNII